MPAPHVVPPLEFAPCLPTVFRLLAEFYVHCPAASPDYLILLAEACDQVAAPETEYFNPHVTRAIAALAAELRRRAPDYAGGSRP